MRVCDCACVQLTNKRDRLCSSGAQRRKFEKEDEVVLQQLCGHIRHGQANAIQYQRQVDKAAVAQQVSGERRIDRCIHRARALASARSGDAANATPEPRLAEPR